MEMRSSDRGDQADFDLDEEGGEGEGGNRGGGQSGKPYDRAWTGRGTNWGGPGMGF
jgi:hypothetical protein